MKGVTPYRLVHRHITYTANSVECQKNVPTSFNKKRVEQEAEKTGKS
jgi:hypothetical protein